MNLEDRNNLRELKTEKKNKTIYFTSVYEFTHKLSYWIELVKYLHCQNIDRHYYYNQTQLLHIYW